MSIDQTKVIDFLGTNDTENSCVLVISDHLEWNSWEHLLVRQEKLNNYLSFIESGEIYEARPEARGRSIEVTFQCQFAPESEDDFKFLQLARDAVQNAGFRFSVLVDAKEFQIPKTTTEQTK